MSWVGSTDADRLGELREVLTRCVKCGRCRSVCPVFGALRRETAVARGKMALLETGLAAAVAGRAAPLSRLSGYLSLCLLCGQCTSNCPNGAGAHEAVRMARALVAGREGLPLSKRLLSKVAAADRRVRDRLLKGGRVVQRTLVKAVPETRGLHLRLPRPSARRGWIPSLASPFFLEGCPRTRPAPLARSRVGLFVGCTIHYLAPRVGEAAVELLNGLGCTVVIPPDQGCCGLMAHGMGDEARSHRLAVETLEAFADSTLAAIVAPCASCAAHLKKGFQEVLRHDPEARREAARVFGSRVRDLSEFLAQDGLPQRLAARQQSAPQRTLTYHDPCHLAQGLNIREEPRRLLGALRCHGYVEMKGAERCCGMGGAFRIAHPTVSRRILWEKVRAVQETGAEAVVTGCMGCWMQLQDGLRRRASPVQVLHLAEVLVADMGAVPV